MLKNTLFIGFFLFSLTVVGQDNEKALPEVRIELSNDSILLMGGSQQITAKKIGLYASETSLSSL